MHKECPVCNKKVPKKYIEAHKKYHFKNDKEGYENLREIDSRMLK